MKGKLKRLAAVALLLIGVGLIFLQPARELWDGGGAKREAAAAVKQYHHGGKKRPVGAVLSMPSVGLELPIYKSRADLNYGVYTELVDDKPSTAPGDNNYVLAGHSSYVPTVWLSPMFKLTTANGYVRNASAPYRPSDYQGGTGKPGNIIIYTKQATYTYRADKAYTVRGNDDSILSDPAVGSAKQIRVFTCPRHINHPPFRYVVQGSLTKVQPTAAGRRAGVDTTLTTKTQTTYHSGALSSN